jgi:hypothetical protein
MLGIALGFFVCLFGWLVAIYLFFNLFCSICSIGASNQCLHLEPLHRPFFVVGFSETGSHKLFAWAGFEQ